MPRVLYSHQEYADMLFTLGLQQGNMLACPQTVKSLIDGLLITRIADSGVTPIDIFKERVGIIRSIFIGGEEFLRMYQNQNGEIRWRCRDSRCKSRIQTDASSINLIREKCNFTHNHGPVHRTGALSQPRTVPIKICGSAGAGAAATLTPSYPDKEICHDGNGFTDCPKSSRKRQVPRYWYCGNEFRRSYTAKNGTTRWICIAANCRAKICTDSSGNVIRERSRLTHTKHKTRIKRNSSSSSKAPEDLASGDESHPNSIDPVPSKMKTVRIVLEKIKIPIRCGRSGGGIRGRPRGRGVRRKWPRGAVRSRSEPPKTSDLPMEAPTTLESEGEAKDVASGSSDIARLRNQNPRGRRGRRGGLVRAMNSCNIVPTRGGADDQTPHSGEKTAVPRGRPRGRPPGKKRRTELLKDADNDTSATTVSDDDSQPVSNFTIPKNVIRLIRTETSPFSFGEPNDVDAAVLNRSAQMTDKAPEETSATKNPKIRRRRKTRKVWYPSVRNKASCEKRQLLKYYRSKRGKGTGVTTLENQLGSSVGKRQRRKKGEGVAHMKWLRKIRHEKPCRKSKRFTVKSEVIDFSEEQLQRFQSDRNDVIYISESDSECMDSSSDQNNVSVPVIQDTVSNSSHSFPNNLHISNESAKPAAVDNVVSGIFRDLSNLDLCQPAINTEFDIQPSASTHFEADSFSVIPPPPLLSSRSSDISILPPADDIADIYDTDVDVQPSASTHLDAEPFSVIPQLPLLSSRSSGVSVLPPADDIADIYDAEFDVQPSTSAQFKAETFSVIPQPSLLSSRSSDVSVLPPADDIADTEFDIQPSASTYFGTDPFSVVPQPPLLSTHSSGVSILSPARTNFNNEANIGLVKPPMLSSEIDTYHPSNEPVIPTPEFCTELIVQPSMLSDSTTVPFIKQESPLSPDPDVHMTPAELVDIIVISDSD